MLIEDDGHLSCLDHSVTVLLVERKTATGKKTAPHKTARTFLVAALYIIHFPCFFFKNFRLVELAT